MLLLPVTEARAVPESTLVKKMLTFLERRLDTTLYRAMENEGTPERAGAAFAVAHQLKNRGILDHVYRWKKFPDEPYMHIYMCKKETFSGTGFDFFNDESALWKTLGEYVERYLWMYSTDYTKKQIFTSPRELQGETLDISTLIGFSDQQRQDPILQVSSDTIFSWIPVKELTQGVTIFSPTQLFSAHYARNNVRRPEAPEKQEPMLRWCVTTGLATGQTVSEAITKGILESIERDAFMRTFVNKKNPQKIDLTVLATDDPDIAFLLNYFERYKLNLHILLLDTEFSPSVILAVLEDKTGKGPRISVGANADFDDKRAILNAAAEALITRLSVKNTMHQRVQMDKIQKKERIRYWAQKKNSDDISFLLQGRMRGADISVDRFQPHERSAYFEKKKDLLLNEITSFGMKCYAYEITDQKLGVLPIPSCQIVVPELHPLHLDERFPYFSGPRLEKYPINTEPHPFP